MNPSPRPDQLPSPPPDRSGWPWTEATPLRSDEAAWPRISLITPSFNQASFIEETIRSVLLQSYPQLEYIVIDGGSGDGTVDILRRYEPWLRWVSEPDRGQTDAINKGLRQASGDLLAYLNSDDSLLLGALYAIGQYAQAHPKMGLIYGECCVIDQHSQLIGWLPRRPFDLKRTIERAEFLPQQAVFWTRAAMERSGLLDDTLEYAMDYEYFIRIARVMPVAYVPQPIACFRMQATSKTVSHAEKHWRETLAVSERYGLKPWMLWYWIRRVRHWGLRGLPTPIQQWVRRRLNRAQDPYLFSQRDSHAHDS